jgi:hypothetical protein
MPNWNDFQVFQQSVNQIGNNVASVLRERNRAKSFEDLRTKISQGRKKADVMTHMVANPTGSPMPMETDQAAFPTPPPVGIEDILQAVQGGGVEPVQAYTAGRALAEPNTKILPEGGMLVTPTGQEIRRNPSTGGAGQHWGEISNKPFQGPDGVYMREIIEADQYGNKHTRYEHISEPGAGQFKNAEALLKTQQTMANLKRARELTDRQRVIEQEITDLKKPSPAVEDWTKPSLTPEQKEAKNRAYYNELMQIGRELDDIHKTEGWDWQFKPWDYQPLESKPSGTPPPAGTSAPGASNFAPSGQMDAGKLLQQVQQRLDELRAKQSGKK